MKPTTKPTILSQCLAAGLAAGMFATQVQANEDVIQNSFFP